MKPSNNETYQIYKTLRLNLLLLTFAYLKSLQLETQGKMLDYRHWNVETKIGHT